MNRLAWNARGAFGEPSLGVVSSLAIKVSLNFDEPR